MPKGQKFSPSDVDVLLDAVEDVLPIGADEWDLVEHQYNGRRAEGRPMREAVSLKRKYNGLRKMPKPTGNCLFLVQCLTWSMH
jgi:hypothetical protein